MAASKSTLSVLSDIKFYLPRAINVRYSKTVNPECVHIAIETLLSTHHYNLIDKRLLTSDDYEQTVAAIISDPQDALCTYGGVDSTWR